MLSTAILCWLRTVVRRVSLRVFQRDRKWYLRTTRTRLQDYSIPLRERIILPDYRKRLRNCMMCLCSTHVDFARRPSQSILLSSSSLEVGFEIRYTRLLTSNSFSVDLSLASLWYQVKLTCPKSGQLALQQYRLRKAAVRS